MEEPDYGQCPSGVIAKLVGIAEDVAEIKSDVKSQNGRLRILEDFKARTEGFAAGASAGSKWTLGLIATLGTILGGGGVGSIVVVLVKVL